MRLFLGALALFLFGTLSAVAAEAPSPPPTPPAIEEEVPANEVDPQALYETGKAIWESYVPETIRDQIEFPDQETWAAFFQKLQGSLDQDSFVQVAELEPEVQQAVASLREVPLYAEYLDWLQERLDFVEAAKLIALTEVPAIEPAPEPPSEEPPTPTLPPAPPGDLPHIGPTPAPTPRPTAPPRIPTPVPPTPPSSEVRAEIPHYPLWLNRLRDRPRPQQAGALMPRLKAVFAAEGIPAELAWIAEVESSLNPRAKSPAGALGLFQLMPQTARSLGLSTFPFDERTHPEKSAQAAARYLKHLHQKFGNWPLALAAYNAGDGRVARALKKHGGAKPEFSDIAGSLSVETRMYVPKVLATVRVREGVALTQLPRPFRAPLRPVATDQ